ncbi:MAG: hypothetical protein ACRDY2_02835 [Acidimicrobiales bacterium]
MLQTGARARWSGSTQLLGEARPGAPRAARLAAGRARRLAAGGGPTAAGGGPTEEPAAHPVLRTSPRAAVPVARLSTAVGAGRGPQLRAGLRWGRW